MESKMKRLFITLSMMLVAFMANAQSCPDDNHPHAIDLGLPSGTKWACCNVDTDYPKNQSPTNYGGYYAWGETKTKSKYDWDNYIHCDGSETTCHDLGSDIAGTEYDVAHVQWGGSWVMPSQDQIQELTNKCSCTYIERNGVNGELFTGPNGGTIFLPESEFWRNDRINSASLYSNDDSSNSETDIMPNAGYYWSSTLKPSYTNVASYLLISYGNAFWDSYMFLSTGLTVRPVISGSGNGVNNIIHSGLSDDDPSQAVYAIYDLQGRRLQKAPERGLYIRDGKKIVYREKKRQ